LSRCSVFSSSLAPPPTSTLFPYTTLFRSLRVLRLGGRGAGATTTTTASAGAAAGATTRRLTRRRRGRGRRRQQVGRPGTERPGRSEEHTSELQSPYDLVCRLLLEKKKKNN